MRGFNPRHFYFASSRSSQAIALGPAAKDVWSGFPLNLVSLPETRCTQLPCFKKGAHSFAKDRGPLRLRRAALAILRRHFCGKGFPEEFLETLGGALKEPTSAPLSSWLARAGFLQSAVASRAE